MTLFKALAAILLISAASAPAFGHQSTVPTGSNISRPVDTTPAEKGRALQIRQKFVRCIYQRRRKEVDALLAASDTLAVDLKGAGLSSLISGLRLETCLSSATNITDTSLILKAKFSGLRSMLLEESYRTHNPTPPAWLAAMPARPLRTFVSKDEALPVAIGSAAFADCLVAAAPVQSDTFIRTASGSAAEKDALKPLIPFLGPCVPQGQTIKFDIPAVRAYVADGLWTAWHTVSKAQAAQVKALQ
jgi:hypothetical protein